MRNIIAASPKRSTGAAAVNADGAVGVWGPRGGAPGAARSLITQATALHSPAELVVCSFASGSSAADWDFLKWLPHTTSPKSPFAEMSLADSQSAGTALLNARHYRQAAAELHRVLELAPRLADAHVNMGYAMIGLERHAVARDFFGSAIDLNRNQRNAYFGLALALEGLGDLEGALGAMRSYVHLARGEDPYLRRGRAAIWEWGTAAGAHSRERE